MQRIEERLSTSPESIAKVLKGFFLPKEFGNGFRLASEGAAMKSACANMSLSYDSGDWENATVDSLLPANEVIVCLMGNPLRSYIQYEPNAAGTRFTYVAQNVDSTVTFPITQGAAASNVPSIELIPRWATPTTTYQPHGAIMFPGYDDAGHYYLFVSSGTDSTLNPARGLVVGLTAPPVAAVAGYVDWYYFNGKTPQLWLRQTITTGVQSYSCIPPPTGAYMYATITYLENILPTLQSATLSVDEEGSVWGHHCVSDIQTLLGSAYGIRVNSASIRVQNDSSPLYREGSITSCSLPSNTLWLSIASQGVDAISTLQNYRERTADKGYYGVLLPDSDDDVSEFYDDISASSLGFAQQLNQAAYPLIERRPFKVVGLTITSTQGRSITFDVTHTIEYLTNNKLVGRFNSDFSEKAITAAIVIASTMETDYDNPVHWREILQTIATYLPVGTRTLMTALELFGYNNIASQIQQRQPLVERLADNAYEIATASAKNKRGADR